MGKTAVVLLVPEADRVVSRWQRSLTAAGREGLGAHVTLLVPFADSRYVDAHLPDLQEALSQFAPFTCSFRRTACFDGRTRVLYLVPEPHEMLAAMIDSVLRRFPQFPAYRGTVSGVVPHLTVALHEDAAALRAIEKEVAHGLPIEARIDAATIVEHEEGRWRERTSIILG